MPTISNVRETGLVLLLAFAGSPVLGADEAPTAKVSAPAEPSGLLPVPDFGGDLWHSIRLTGDWGGTRTDLANKGVHFDVTFTQTVQSVVDGGRESGTRYGGSLDYVLTLDLMRMNVMPGAMVKFRGESRYGEAINDISGLILPANSDGFFPLTDELDDEVGFYLTNLVYYQFLSEQFGVVFGKIDTLDGDPNEFASGRGVSQFMNGNLVIPISPLLSAPYSTLAVGVVWMPTRQITVSSMVFNAKDASSTTGFEGFGEGTGWLTEAQFQYRLCNLPGGQNVGFLYGFDNNFVELGERFVFQPGAGFEPSTTDETWAFYWSLWQYLFIEQPSEALVNITDGRQDHQGVGLFLRVGFADEDTSPLKFNISGGIGGKGIIPGRDNDTFGVGFYYTAIEADRLVSVLGIDDELAGFEAYYSLVITPAAQLTFDVQVAETPSEDLDTVVILGVRLNLQF